MTLADDDATEITLTANKASVEEGDSATTVTVTAETDGDTFPANRTVRVKIGKVGDSATSGTDYSAVTPFDITITKNKTSGTGTFTLTPTDDNIIEGEESHRGVGHFQRTDGERHEHRDRGQRETEDHPGHRAVPGDGPGKAAGGRRGRRG